MIKVSKGKVKEPKSLSEKMSVGQKSKTKAIHFFNQKRNQEKTFDFDNYKSEDVKLALEKIFSKKCAYCESRYAPSSILDVEHFRPKAAIKDYFSGKVLKPGYYWLAWDWNNLLPSCQNCNRQQYRKIWGKEEKVLSGKGELFPIDTDSVRARKPGQEKIEEPLLLNPCLDDPKVHITFTDDGLVLPVFIQGRYSRKGEISIEVYGLMREDLVDERKYILKALNARIENIKRFDNLCRLHPKDKNHKESLRLELDELKDFLKKEQPYLGMIEEVLARRLDIKV